MQMMFFEVVTDNMRVHTIFTQHIVRPELLTILPEHVKEASLTCLEELLHNPWYGIRISCQLTCLRC